MDPKDSTRDLTTRAAQVISRFSEARVFVVDDSIANIALIDAVLLRAGFKHRFTETDSRRVNERLSEVDPDLVVLDLHMPHLDGIEVLTQIRSSTSSDYLPILILTADATSGATQRALAAGAQDFVTKPFNNTEFLLRCETLLATRFLYSTLRGSLIRQEVEHRDAQEGLSLALAAERQTVQGLEVLDQVKSLLLQTVSHDLRSPVSAVLVLAGMLAADANGSQPLPDEAKRSVIAAIDVSARQMSRLLQDILDSDPLRAVVDPAAPCDVGELVSRVLVEVDLAAEHPLDLQLESVMVNIDPVHIERIVVNLLMNAKQHVDPGVPIIVTTCTDGDGVVITVEDAGNGIPDGVADTIFEPFRKGDTGSKGLGLGLSLVSRFTQLHGGRAWAENRPGGGAVFRVFLPSPVGASV